MPVDVTLPPIRIGFEYSVEVDFPAGFLQAGEGVRTKLRRYVGDTEVAIPTDSRDGDIVTWELSEMQTGDMPPGQYQAEAEIYDTANPGMSGTILTDNRYIIDCNRSPSE